MLKGGGHAMNWKVCGRYNTVAYSKSIILASAQKDESERSNS
jgi:hypothetical protein